MCELFAARGRDAHFTGAALIRYGPLTDWSAEPSPGARGTADDNTVLFVSPRWVKKCRLWVIYFGILDNPEDLEHSVLLVYPKQLTYSTTLPTLLVLFCRSTQLEWNSFHREINEMTDFGKKSIIDCRIHY